MVSTSNKSPLSMWLFAVLFALQIHTVFANTEKAIFLGPSSIHVPVEHPTLEALRLQELSPQPQHSSLRTHIQAEFPTNTSKHGHPSWFLLHQLKRGQRYEVRQPTAFRLNTYELPKVFGTPELIASVAQYSETRQLGLTDVVDEKPSIYGRGSIDDSSVLLLEVLAAADYYTTNKTLMTHVPPVFVDIILDPFIFNVFPRSLVPTAGYILLLAIGSWYLSKYISRWLVEIAREGTSTDKKES
ncbi:Uncharacterized protein BP5553_02778 [Venustampulla echinocandica]|uniref:Uncharacterized protein n=1 Tax=Venustampulla echinocandica TaxID=2656787 RepID=A0A370TSH0_9HELO|nr:Uncharacterized protein BP5553_02778 [Venustampulla echinocandica]RDL38438.1 Uncharacterized protein BP5553_02778 [Venustampulla echinocandica]